LKVFPRRQGRDFTNVARKPNSLGGQSGASSLMLTVFDLFFCTSFLSIPEFTAYFIRVSGGCGTSSFERIICCSSQMFWSYPQNVRWMLAVLKFGFSRPLVLNSYNWDLFSAKLTYL